MESVENVLLHESPNRHHWVGEMGQRIQRIRCVPLVAACVARTSGSVLELGSDDYVTPILHLLCKGRSLVTIDTDATHLLRLEDLSTVRHRIAFTSGWHKAEIKGPWDVAYVASFPVESRLPLVERLRSETQMIVVPDTNEGETEYNRLFATFKYRYDFSRNRGCQTTVVSDTVRFEP